MITDGIRSITAMLKIYNGVVIEGVALHLGHAKPTWIPLKNQGRSGKG